MCIGTQISLYNTITFSRGFRQCAICINLSLLIYSQLSPICNRLKSWLCKALSNAPLTLLLNLPNDDFCFVVKKNFCFFCVYYAPADMLYSLVQTKPSREIYAKSPIFLFALEIPGLMCYTMRCVHMPL